MDVLSYQVPGEITIGVRKAAGRQRGEGTAAVVNVEWQNQFALIGKRFILPKRTKSKGIKVGRRPPLTTLIRHNGGAGRPWFS